MQFVRTLKFRPWSAIRIRTIAVELKPHQPFISALLLVFRLIGVLTSPSYFFN